jgi:alpha-beta hydrolase superfamily lysophospholipase
MQRTDTTITAADGETIELTSWLPDGEPSLIVHVMHGASEHLERYARIAGVLVASGYGVYAHDHHGHGRTAARSGSFGRRRRGGWEMIIADAHAVTEHVRARHPSARLVLFGHSMGSFIAQGYVERWGSELSGVVYSGSSHGLEGGADLVPILDQMAETAPDAPSELFAAIFAGFNAPFADECTTGFEWLSRDQRQVAAYVADPWCGTGNPLSNGFVADMIRGMLATWDPAAEEVVTKDLPTLVIAGDHDPVGGNGESVRALVARYEELGIGPVTLHLYPGARHELLNETNAADVDTDLLAWLATV